MITSDEGVRAGRSIPLKKNVDDALKNPNVTSVEHVVVLKRTGKLTGRKGATCGGTTWLSKRAISTRRKR